jgi:tetratricopeptide (TPR) repeat protein
MDQLTAHLDRGWDLAQSGDARGAMSSARRAIELAPDSPEAYNLLGYAASLDGDCDEAVEAYEQALALDDGYVEAMLNAAELYVHPLRDYEQALELCERVLELSEFDDEIVDAHLLRFEAYWAMGDDDNAKKALSRLARGPYETAAQNFLVGRAWVELGEHDRAKPLVAAALEADPHNPEACYYAGLLAEADGDRAQANAHFLRVRQLEADIGPPSWSPDEGAFMAFVERATASLPSDQRELLRNAEVFVVDLPGPEMIVDGVDVHALAMLDLLAPNPPGKVVSGGRLRAFVYAVNVLRTAGALDRVEDTIRESLERELGHLVEEFGGRAGAN